jgi:hypothetical protein
MAWNQIWLSDSLHTLMNWDQKFISKTPPNMLAYCAIQQYMTSHLHHVTVATLRKLLEQFETVVAIIQAEEVSCFFQKPQVTFIDGDRRRSAMSNSSCFLTLSGNMERRRKCQFGGSAQRQIDGIISFL